MNTIKELSIVIPCYNEERRLPRTIDLVLRFAEKHFKRFEIILIDDGSTDKTHAICEHYASIDKRIVCNKPRPNRGKGFSVREGMLLGRMRHILFSDADLSTPIEEIITFNRFAADYEVIIGDRTNRRLLTKRQPLWRETMGKTFNLIMRMIVGIGFPDTQCGFKLFSKKAAHDIFSHLRTEGFAFDVEVLALAKRLGYKVRAVHVHWENDEESKVNVASDSLKMLKETWHIRQRMQKSFK